MTKLYGAVAALVIGALLVGIGFGWGHHEASKALTTYKAEVKQNSAVAGAVAVQHNTDVQNTASSTQAASVATYQASIDNENTIRTGALADLAAGRRRVYVRTLVPAHAVSEAAADSGTDQPTQSATLSYGSAAFFYNQSIAADKDVADFNLCVDRVRQDMQEINGSITVAPGSPGASPTRPQ